MAAQGLTIVSTIPSSSTTHQSSRKPINQFMFFSLTNSFLGRTKLSICPSTSNLSAPNRRSPIVAVANFPTSNKDAVAAEKKPKWSSRALRAYTFADVETRKLKHPTLGSDTLLLGLLLEGTSRTAKYLREHGITHFKARDEVVKLLGKGDKFQPDSPKHSPFTQLSKRCLEQAVEIKLKSGEDGELTCAHLLLGMWAVKESAAHKVLAALGFDEEKRKQVAKTMDDDAKPNFKRSLLEDLAAN